MLSNQKTVIGIILFSVIILSIGYASYNFEITYTNPGASNVSIVGDFNNWNPASHNMTKKAGGVWSINLNLSEGKYHYKFVVDGNWITDPNNPDTIDDGFGELNSILSVPGGISTQTDEPKAAVAASDYTFEYQGAANNVYVAGNFNDWNDKATSLNNIGGNRWVSDIKLPPGEYIYKFVVDGNWIPDPKNPAQVEDGFGGINSLLIISQKRSDLDINRKKYLIFEKWGVNKVSVAGEFNNWNPDKDYMEKISEGVFKFSASNFNTGKSFFKFVIDGKWEGGDDRVIFINEAGEIYNPRTFVQWAYYDDFNQVRIVASKSIDELKKADYSFNNNIKIQNIRYEENLMGKYYNGYDGQEHRNLGINPDAAGSAVVYITTSVIDVSLLNKIIIKNLSDNPLEFDLTPSDKFFDNNFISIKKLGSYYDESKDATIFRIFSPRASEVKLHLYDRYDQPDQNPTLTLEMFKDYQGVWETLDLGDLRGQYYKYTIDGPQGDGEGFDSDWYISDPYAVANVHNTGKSIILDIDMTDDVFTGWEATDFQIPAMKDLIIWEASLRDMTMHKSSGVKDDLKGTYLGLLETENTEAGIEYLKKLGVNAIEFLPLHEFDDDPPGTYHWGYMSSFYIAPESSYASDPTTGKQVTELKKMVDTLHKNGFAVLLDVVYNHSGAPHYYRGIDNKYYYRLNENLGYQNYSGCGNDFKSENPMARRLIIDSLKYYVKHFNFDGFRFDLAELIDLETFRIIEKELQKIKPDVILILEPWSFRGGIKGDLPHTSYAYWNDDFRNNVKRFAKGEMDNAADLQNLIMGSVKTFATSPLQTINYLESHDDRTLADDLSTRDDHNGFILNDLERDRNRLTATVLFTSAGVPMLSGGQEFLRSKRGIDNSYDSGDEINAIQWDMKHTNKTEFEYYKGLIALRNSTLGNIIKFTGEKHSADNYYKFIQSNNTKALGYFINNDLSNGNKRILVLINGDNNSSASFSISLPDGNWIMIADGIKVDLNGIDNKNYSGSFSFNLPAVSSAIFMEK